MIYAMSDIHGNLKRFESVLKQINLQNEDVLYILGDVIDRYPDGIEILRRIMKMKNVKMLLGNHEYMMLEALDTEHENELEKFKAFRRWLCNGGEVTLNAFKQCTAEQQKKLLDYLKSLPVNEKVSVGSNNYLLVHGSPLENYNPREYDSKDRTHYAVWERWYPEDPVPKGYTLVFGHTPTEHFNECKNPLEIWKGENAVGIDCGCGFFNVENNFYPNGRLACVRLDDMKIFYSEDALCYGY